MLCNHNCLPTCLDHWFVVVYKQCISALLYDILWTKKESLNSLQYYISLPRDDWQTCALSLGFVTVVFKKRFFPSTPSWVKSGRLGVKAQGKSFP